MSNPERGAYSPPTEEPLTFDARRPVRGRAPMPMMLMFSTGILFVLIVGVVLIVRSGLGRESEAPPMVGKPVDSMKAAPPPEAQPQDPAQGLQIYQQGEGQTAPASPNFAPPPEQPQPRSEIVPAPAPVAAQPTAPVVALPTTPPPPAFKPAVVATAPSAKPAQQKPAQQKPAQQKPAPVIVLTQPKPAPAKPAVVAAKPLPAKPATVVVKGAPAASAKAVAVVAPKAVAETATAGGASVQIGAFSSQALADKGWNDAVKIAPGAAAGKGKKVQAVDKDGATLYRTTVTGFASRDAATAFCNQLKAAGKSCFVK